VGPMAKVILCRVNENVAADIRLQVTRTRPFPGWIWVPQMAPSEKLFRQYLNWRKQDLWPGKWPEYESAFLREMEGMKKYLDRIEGQLRAGRSVALACFCKDVRYCHRSLLGRYFTERSFQVDQR